jgi:CubicO group peptidase (beta-lactamase class C family)
LKSLVTGLFLLLLVTRLHADELADTLLTIQTRQSIPVMGWVVLLPGQSPRTEVIGARAGLTTPLRFGSITKTFTAITLLNAAEARGVSIDTRLDMIAGDRPWRNSFPVPLTLHHLITLTAGHSDLGFKAFNDNTPRSLADSLQRNQVALTSWWPPGLVHSYSNATPGLSALAVERLTGKPFAEAMSALLFEPLGLAQASLSPDPNLPGGFRADGVTPIDYWHTTFPAFGALNMSMSDMTLFLQTLLAGGRQGARTVWSPATQQTLLVPTMGLGHAAGLDIGYAAGMYTRIAQGLVWHTHGGDADGYRSRYAVLPEHQAGYAILINTDNPFALRKLEAILERYIIRAVQLPTLPPFPGKPLQTSADGEYYPVGTRFDVAAWRNCKMPRLSITASKGGLTLARGQDITQLKHLGANQFAGDNEPAVTAVITRDAFGSVYFLGEYGNFVRLRSYGKEPTAVIPSFLSHCIPQ